MLERVHKVLANAGVASRRACEELVAQGRVTIDGDVVTEPGTRVDPAASDLRVDGDRIRPRPVAYLAVYKPRGYISAVVPARADEPCVADLVHPRFGRVYPVGRLDKDSEGLIVLTSDGALTERLTHPRHEVAKVYRVSTRETITPDALAQLREGVWLADGRASVETARLLRGKGAERHGGVLELTLREGKNRQIRRMLAKVGLKVRRLVRVAVGPVQLGDLGVGMVRTLETKELEALRKAAGLSDDDGVEGAAGAARPRAAGAKRGAKAAAAPRGAKPAKVGASRATGRPERAGAAPSPRGDAARARAARGAAKGGAKRPAVRGEEARRGPRGPDREPAAAPQGRGAGRPARKPARSANAAGGAKPARGAKGARGAKPTRGGKPARGAKVAKKGPRRGGGRG